MQGKYDILVLDDESIVGERLQAGLEKDGYGVEIFNDPNKALIRFNEKDFDVVVTDIRMNDVDGIQILERVMSKSKRTKVIMITGYASMELARESMAKGAFDFIAKPFKMKELREIIKKAADALRDEDSEASKTAKAG